MNIGNYTKRILAVLLVAGLLSTCFPAYLHAEETDNYTETVTLQDDNYVSNEVFAMCDSEEEALSIAEEYSLATGIEFNLNEYAYGVAVYSIEDKDDALDPVIEAVNAGLNPELDLVEVYPDYYMELMSVERPDNSRENFNDPFTKSDSDKYQWYHEMIEDKLLWDEMELLKSANADPYDDIVYDGPLPDDFIDNLNDEVVAVIDSGINEYHEDFLLPGGGSVIVEPSDVAGAPTGYSDQNGHGSNVAGIIGNVSDNSKGGRGVAAGVKIMPINVCPDSSGKGITSSISTQAINLAAEKKKAYINGEAGGLNICVINMSIGGSSYSGGMNKAVQNAIDLGITVVAAATNSGSSDYGYPASYDNVISVASVNSYYVKSVFSNYGDKISISAPGGERKGITIEEIGVHESGEDCYASYMGADASYAGFHGTSQASPMVAACAALLYAKNPDITPLEVKMQMEATAKRVYGSYRIGAGCLNVAEALGVTRDVEAPVPDVEPGMVMPSGFDVNLSIPGISLSDYEGSIYYTVDGSDPDLRDYDNTYKLDLSNPEAIHFEYNEMLNNDTETLKVISVLFGKKSEIVSYQYKYYLGDDIPVIARTDGAYMEDGSLEIAPDKTIGLKLYDKKSGEEIKANWISSDPFTVLVDAKGRVSGINLSDTGTLIRALPVSDKYMPIDIPVYVKKSAEWLELDPFVGEEVIEMYYGDTYDLCDTWRIIPEEASQTVKYETSNSSVIEVDNQGLVRALKAGSAVITISAADGSGVKDTVSFKVCSDLSGLVIESSSGKDYISAEGTMRFKLKSDNYMPVPKNADIFWDFSPDSKMQGIEYYAQIDNKTGAVTAKSNSYISYPIDVEVIAESLYFGVSAEYDFTIYPKLRTLKINSDYSDPYGCYSRTDSVFYLKSYKSFDLNEYFDDIVIASPNYCAKSFVYKSSNENVAYIVPSEEGIDGNSLGVLKTRAPGSATLTISSTDGSGISIRISIVVLDTVSIKNTSAVDCISPGKSLSFKLITDSGKTVPDGNVTWSVSGVKTNSGFEMVNLVDVNAKTGVVTMKPQTYSEVRDFLKRTSGSGFDYLIVSAVYYPSKDSDFCYRAARNLKIVPTLTAMVKIRDNAGNDISELNFSRIGDKTVIYPYSLPDVALNSGYIFSSSNPSVVKVDSNGEIEAISKGTAYVNVTAGDLSGKKARVKVIVDYPYVKQISLSETTVYLRTPINEGMSEPVDTKYKETVDFKVTKIAPAEALQDVSVTSLNENIARVKRKDGCDVNDPVYTIEPVNKGTARIRVTALDGSNKSAYIRVNVVRPNINFTLRLGNGLNTLNASESKSLKLITEGNPSSKAVRYYLCGQEMNEYVTLNSLTGTIKVKNAKTIGTEERLIYVYARAEDEWHYTSEPLMIRINPGIVYINELHVKSSNSRYDIASGTKINMKALCNENATDKKITWHIYDEDAGNPGFPKAEEGSMYATVNKNGVVTVKSDIQNRVKVYVKAVAVNGEHVESSAVPLSVYPRIKSITVAGNSSVYIGDYIELEADTISTGSDEAFSEFKVTYSTGAAKVYLEPNPVTGKYDGTHIRVYGLKKGRTKIVFASLDGSGKKTSFYVNTL